MRPGFPLLVAVLSVLGLILWLSLGRGPEPAPVGPAAPVEETSGLQERMGGSALPCAVPLAWRIARVDREFALGTEEVAGALAESMTLWEDAVGRRLFSSDSAGGHPVRLIHDERQARAEERGRLEAELQRTGDALETSRAGLAELEEAYARAAALQQQRVRELQRRTSVHNEAVRRWNESGDAPQEVLLELRAEETALQRERLEQLDAEREVGALGARAQEARAALEREASEQGRRRAALEEAFPPTAVEAGVYREAARMEEGRVAAVSREIRIYRFDDRDDLVRILAHELGHALGLGHAGLAGALMSESYGKGGLPSGAPAVQPDDLEKLRERCPGLFEPR